MDKSDGDELFKDYFETFNSEAAAPACEASSEDPLAGFGSDLNLECLGPSNPEELLNPLSSLVSQSDLLAIPEAGHQAGSSDHQYGQVWSQPTGLGTLSDQQGGQQAFVDPHYDSGQDILPTHDDTVMSVIKQEISDPSPADPAPSLGLRIAGFAVDPDLCSVVDPHPPSHQNAENIAQPHQESTVFGNIPDQSFHQTVPASVQSILSTAFKPPSLASINFPRFKKQLRKVYQINGQGFVILSSKGDANNTGSDWKLFFPMDSPLLRGDFSETFSVTSGGITFKNIQLQNKMNRFFVDQVENWNILVRRKAAFIVNVQNFRFNDHSSKDITIRHSFKEAPNIQFTTKFRANSDEFANLGDEFVYDNPINPNRNAFAMQIYNFLKNMYFQIHRHPDDMDDNMVWDAAVLFESDLWNQFQIDVEVEKSINQALNNYSERLKQSTGYAYLKRFPHIQYLALTKAHIRINQFNSATPTPYTQSATGVITGGPSVTPPTPQVRAVTVNRPRTIAPRHQPPQSQPFSHIPSNVPQAPGNSVQHQYRKYGEHFYLNHGRGSILVGTKKPTPAPSANASSSIIRAIRAPVPVLPQPGPSNQQQQTPIIVSVASMASSSVSSSMSPASVKFVCPLPAAKCPDQREKDRDGLINHLTLGHYSSKIAESVTGHQKKKG